MWCPGLMRFDLRFRGQEALEVPPIVQLIQTVLCCVLVPLPLGNLNLNVLLWPGACVLAVACSPSSPTLSYLAEGIP